MTVQEQIEANNKVIVASKGLLAPITGKERHLTLGTGHCTAFCKAANAGCRTPISYIRDAVGNINLPFLKMQRQYKTMLEKGWEFTQLPWQVEEVVLEGKGVREDLIFADADGRRRPQPERIGAQLNDP